MAVHVSIHDVSPAWEHEVEAALDACHAHGIRPALLVVPNFHGAWPLAEHPRYAQRLRALQADGHEVYLHGYFHQSRPRPRGAGLKWVFAQSVVSAGEAEFADLTPDEADARLDAGLDVLKAAGLRADGFVPPAWMMPRWLLPKLAARDLRFTEDHLRVYAPASQRARTSVVLNFASRSPARLISTVAYCRMARPARALFPARVAIHPGDMRVALLRREVDSLLAWAAPDAVDLGAALFE